MNSSLKPDLGQVHDSGTAQLLPIREEDLPQLAKTAREAASKTRAQAARELGVKFSSIFNAEENPKASLFRLRKKLIETYSSYQLVGPEFHLQWLGVNNEPEMLIEADLLRGPLPQANNRAKQEEKFTQSDSQNMNTATESIRRNTRTLSQLEVLLLQSLRNLEPAQRNEAAAKLIGAYHKVLEEWRLQDEGASPASTKVRQTMNSRRQKQKKIRAAATSLRPH